MRVDMNAVVLNGQLNPKRGHEAINKTAANSLWQHPTLSVEEVVRPRAIDRDDVIVQVLACSICGTDLHASESDENGYMRFPGTARLPVIPGHEFCGRVVECFNEDSRIKVGQLVAVESIQACLSCRSCKEGHLNQCERIELLGLTIDGALAPFVKVKAQHCYPIDPIVERYAFTHGTDLGALLEPAGGAFNGLFIGPDGKQWVGVKPTDHVAVYGVGAIGGSAIALARAAGALSITAFDRSDERVELAKALGADQAFNIGRLDEAFFSPADILEEVSSGLGVNIAVEATGSPDLMGDIIPSMANRGRVVYLSRTPGMITIDPNRFVDKAIWINFSRGHAGYDIFPTLIKEIANGNLNLTPLITARFSFSDVMSAFNQARELRDGKIIIRLDE
jgi:threonine dehydrogenase-like Zn-dependent dehydrogenase